MITWIQQTFQQHFRIVFTLLLAVVVVAFVFTIGASPGIGQADRKALERPFFGLNLAKEDDQRKLYGDAQISIFLQGGFMGMDEGRLQQYAFVRHAGLALANDLGIPSPTRVEMENHIKEMPRFAGENGQFDGQKYSQFRDSLKKGSNLSEADLSRVLSDEIRFDRVQKLLGGPGYVLPSEVKRELASADTTWNVSVASIDYASFNPGIKPTEEQLTSFFEENKFRYEVTPQVSLSYVEFPAAAHVNEVNVSEADVRAFYDSNPARFPKPADAKPAAATPTIDPSADFAAVRPQVEAALKLERAQRLAAKAASDFALLAFERKLNVQTPDLPKILSERGLTLRDAAPFSAGQPPAELAGNPDLSEEAFRLNKGRPVSDAVPTGKGSVVLFWKETLPSRTPNLAEVRARVSSDFVEEEKRRQFAETGRTLRADVAARVRNGEAFDKAVQAAASAKGISAETRNHGPFTLRQRPQDIDFSVFNALQNLNKGEVSELVRASGNKGLLVYAADKQQPALSDNNPEFAATRAQIAQFTAARNSSEYLQEMVRAELARSTPATP